MKNSKIKEMWKIKKGGYQYFFWEKRRRAAVTLGLFLLPAILCVTGYVQTGTRKNLFTFVAILGCLPACKSLVGWIMAAPRKSMDQKCYESIREHAGQTMVVYDLYFTTYEKNGQVDAMAISGNTLVGYCCRRQEHLVFIREHIENALKRSGYPVTVRLLEELPPFLARLDSMEGSAKAQGPPASAEEKVRQAILAIAL